MSSYYFYLIVLSFLIYLILTDESVYKLFIYAGSLIKFHYEKYKWWIVHNPANPINKYLIWRRALKLATELQKELAEKQKKS